MFKKIILICTGNICRSPMAEALLRQHLGSRGIQVSSAGIAALINCPADPNAQLVMQEQGFDISSHRARQATGELLTGTDLILTLDQTHSDWIQNRFPHLLGRTHKLGRWSSNSDIADPYRKPKEAFDTAFAEINRGTEEWVRRILVA